MSKITLVELLFKALAEPIGILVESASADRLRQRLYITRRESDNPAFNDLALVLSRREPATLLMIMRKTRA